LWRCHTPWQAFQQWRNWLRIIKESGLRPLMDFARKLKPYLRGILASAKYPLNTSVLEGINNKIKVIKRMAYGFRDNEYFFLKIKHAFPGK
ncbi:MAG: ISL3 family transposase, partial [Coraliomargarita sp.]